MSNIYIRYPSDPTLAPTGSATAANQLTEIGYLTTIASNTSQLATAQPVSQSGTWTVSLSSSSIEIGTVDQGNKGSSAQSWYTNLSQVGGATFSLGQQLAAASLPVVLTASQLATLTPLSTVAATQSGTWNVGLNAGSNAIGSITNTSFAVTQSTAASLNATVVGTTAAGSGSATGLVTVQGNASGTPVPVSGTVTITPSGTQAVNLSQVGGTSFALGQQLAAASLPVVLTASQISTLTPLSTVTVQQATAANLNATVTGTVAATQSGTWNVGLNAGSNAIGSITNTSFAVTQSTAASLNATVVGNTAAGSGAATGLLTVQGNASGTPVPVSGTVTITPSGTQAVNLSQVGGASFALGQQLAASSLPVVLTAAQISTLTPLSTVTVQQATAANLNATVTGTVAATQSGTWNITNISGTVSLPTGAATAANQTGGGQKTQVVDGTGNVIASTSNALNSFITNSTLAVTQSGTWTVQPGNTANTTPWLVKGNDSTNSWTIKAASTAAVATDTALVVAVSPNNTITTGASKGRAQANAPIITTYSSTNVTSASYVQLVASTTSAVNMIEIFDSSGVALYFATGAAGSEVNQFVIYPGGNGQINFAIAASTRLSVKAVSTSATSGTGIINLYT